MALLPEALCSQPEESSSFSPHIQDLIVEDAEAVVP